MTNRPIPWMPGPDGRFPDRVVWIVLLMLTLTTLIPLRGYVLDDAHITYRYARNLCEGKGFVYNPGEKVLGTTTPGYTLVLASLHRGSGLPFPELSWALTVILTWLSGLLMRRILATGVGDLSAILGACLLVTNPILSRSLGMEMSLYIFLLLLGTTLLVVWEWSFLAGLTFGFGLWVRPDAGLFLAIPAMWVLVKGLRPSALGEMGLGIGVAILPWLVSSTLYFGSPIPHTLAAKGGTLGDSRWFWRGVFFISKDLLKQNPGYALFIPLAFAGLKHAWQKKPHVLGILLAWSALYFLAFEALDVSNHFIWYWAPLQVGWVIVLACGIEAAQDRVAKSRQSSPKRARTLEGIAGVLVACGLAMQIMSSHRALKDSPRFYAYRDVAAYLEGRSDPDDLIACWEIGVIGYYCDRPLLDLVGLVSPQVTDKGPQEAVASMRPRFTVDAGYPGYSSVKRFDVTPRGGDIDVPTITVFERDNR